MKEAFEFDDFTDEELRVVMKVRLTDHTMQYRLLNVLFSVALIILLLSVFQMIHTQPIFCYTFQSMIRDAGKCIDPATLDYAIELGTAFHPVQVLRVHSL